MKYFFLVWVLLSIGGCSDEGANTLQLRIAVASNFAPTLREILQQFEEQTEHHGVVISGSTGMHYAQIQNGAPFDIFLAADSLRPQRLEAEGNIIFGTRQAYAVGQLALWSPDVDRIDDEGAVLQQLSFRHLAMANPKLAPYGFAAQEVLANLEISEDLEQYIVRGENIGQAYQFVASGHAQLGFVAWSQLQGGGRHPFGSWWIVPQELYAPIIQEGVLLRDSSAGREFLSFLQSDDARRIIRNHGYRVP